MRCRRDSSAQGRGGRADDDLVDIDIGRLVDGVADGSRDTCGASEHALRMLAIWTADTARIASDEGARRED
jgi:hypothetical protein